MRRRSCDIAMHALRSIVTNSVLAAISDEARYPTPMHVKEALQAIFFYPSFALGGAPEAESPTARFLRTIVWAHLSSAASS